MSLINANETADTAAKQGTKNMKYSKFIAIVGLVFFQAAFATESLVNESAIKEVLNAYGGYSYNPIPIIVGLDACKGEVSHVHWTTNGRIVLLMNKKPKACSFKGLELDVNGERLPLTALSHFVRQSDDSYTWDDSGYYGLHFTGNKKYTEKDIKTIKIIDASCQSETCFSTAGAVIAANRTASEAYARANAPVIESYGFPVPDGTVNGDTFMAEFQFYNYLDSNQINGILKTIAYANFNRQRFNSDFEKNKARYELEQKTFASTSAPRELPKYLIFKYPFGFKPESYDFNTKKFAVTPAHKFLPDNLYPSNRVGSRDGILFRPFFEPIVPSIAWYYPAGITYAGETTSGQGVLSITLGYFSQDWGGKGGTNLVSYVTATPEPYESILKTGKPVPMPKVQEDLAKLSGQSTVTGNVYFIGYGIYKVNPSSLSCNGIAASGSIHTGGFQCGIKITPVQYIIKNFLGKENYIINMSELKF